jgi:hypothetical protein
MHVLQRVTTCQEQPTAAWIEHSATVERSMLSSYSKGSAMLSVSCRLSLYGVSVLQDHPIWQASQHVVRA